ncbi:methylisocitrate lyase [Paenibacillus sp. GCM10012303]|jgi:methylisocitrate lyase|uniref:methylisocitrate lyase n=1 Tax=Paenibacillus sp. GCM10012303 TaxID=3317340 RepID=UPI00362315A7
MERGITQRELAERFMALIQGPAALKLPGAHDGLAARMAQLSGFEALYLSGAAYTASRALPDLGVVGSAELADRARELVRATGLPLLVDIDTGFGGVLNAARTAKEMVEANVAAVQLEDQDLPKKCGHLNGKKLVTPEEMIQKIRVIKEVCPSLIVVARTDAKDVEGMDAAISRAQRYVAAGADAIFPEALATEEEFRRFSAAIHVPLLANMTEFGRTPYYTVQQFEAWGYRMVLFPVTSLRVAAKAYELVFREIMELGTQAGALERMMTRKELYEAIRYYDYEKLDASIAATILAGSTEEPER